MLQVFKGFCIFFMLLLAAKSLWVIGVSHSFASLPHKFKALKDQIPREALRRPFGRRLTRVLHWHVLHANLEWGKIVYLLVRARLHPQVIDALKEVYLDEEESLLPYVAVYEKLVYRGLFYHAPVLSKIFLRWYINIPGRLFLALESYQEIRRQEEDL